MSSHRQSMSGEEQFQQVASQAPEAAVAVRELLHAFNWNLTLQIEESRLPLKDAANFLNVEGKIDNCDDLYSIDARNPVANFIFETKTDDEINKFTLKVHKNQIQTLFEQLETIQDNLDKLM